MKLKKWDNVILCRNYKGEKKVLKYVCLDKKTFRHRHFLNNLKRIETKNYIVFNSDNVSLYTKLGKKDIWCLEEEFETNAFISEDMVVLEVIPYKNIFGKLCNNLNFAFYMFKKYGLLLFEKKQKE